jgi:class 3 adenylate cyclase
LPHFIDIHELPDGVTAEDIARVHAADVAIQAKFGVDYLKYWVNQSQGKVFCFCSAPDAESASLVHREASGMAAQRIIAVDPDLVAGYLGEGPVGPTGAVLMLRSQGLDPGTRTIVFTDIVGSTAMTQRLGDTAAMKLVDVHDTIVREALSTNEGREVKHLGDGIMAVFVQAERAVRCAALIQTAIARHAAKHPAEPVQIRVGIATGAPVERQGDFFGSTVQLAARLCAHAAPGQTLVSTPVAEACAPKGLRFLDIGDVVLKGFEQPVRAHAAASAETA